MKRIAADLGVSVTTISKVLNRHADIGPAMRARVLKRVEELGYRPNAVARSLTLKRTHTVGIIIPDLMHSFFVEIVAGLESIVSRRGYGLLLCSSGEDAGKERAELDMLRARQVDGIVLASANATGNTALLRDLTKAGVALVMIDRDDHPNVRCHRVLTDDIEVGRLATAHLIARGCRVIGHITGPPILHARRREDGYRRALADAGMAVDERRIAAGGFMEVDGYRAMQQLLSNSQRVDGVFAVNDPAAIGAMKAVWDAGLRIPDDVAIVGAGDVAYSDLIRVPLTTVRWSKSDVGKSAAELLLDQIEGEGIRPKRVIIPPEIVVRQSA
ncbi:MAG TPA: LacI family DNA-binding transcriptional regulator [Vicinamibacterales bacterium]|nr:LacI family DNA-binding transcriptional regulator [Vicinamibacterales bacterium]